MPHVTMNNLNLPEYMFAISILHTTEDNFGNLTTQNEITEHTQ